MGEAQSAIRLAADAVLIGGEAYAAGVPAAWGDVVDRVYADARDAITDNAAVAVARLVAGTPHIDVGGSVGQRTTEVVSAGMAELLLGAVTLATVVVDECALATGRDRGELVRAALERTAGRDGI